MGENAVPERSGGFGSWSSPLAPALMASSGVGLSSVAFDGDAVLWLERRPTEGARNCVVRSDGGTVTDVIPRDYNARTLVHEYGGGDYAVHDGVVFFANFDDQRVYRVDPGGQPVPITPEPAQPRGDRYADFDVSPDGRRVYCVRERHQAGEEPRNDIVVLDATGVATPRVAASGHDFCSTPRVSPDGTRLVWLTWDHPRMPWDGTELWEGEITIDGTIGRTVQVTGGPDVSVFQPSWGRDGTLYYVADPTGWWNLYRDRGARDGDGPEAVAPMDAEFGVPQWVFGMATYTVLDDGRIVAVVNQGGMSRLAVISRDDAVTYPDLPYTGFGAAAIAGDGYRVAFIAGSASAAPEVALLDAGGTPKVLRRSLDMDLDPALVPQVEPIEFPTTNGQTAYALYYPPTNPAGSAPEGELPPLLVNSHGGPTAQTPAQLSLTSVFWTSRGFGVVYVNYGGSTGYGRPYRDRLKGTWGVVDTDDCVAAARFLAERGSVDPRRLAIRGGSAGGYTTLCALTFRDDFAAGASFYGVADAGALARDTHKFESRYLDGLIGPWPEAEVLYRDRSPLFHTDRLNCPILLLQGLEDKVVPPSQAEEMAAALDAKRLPYAYLAFEGEQHGFRQPATIKRAFEAELSFYGQVFGFTPADDLPPLEVANLR